MKHSPGVEITRTCTFACQLRTKKAKVSLAMIVGGGGGGGGGV